jgi:hypothetical protein
VVKGGRIQRKQCPGNLLQRRKLTGVNRGAIVLLKTEQEKLSISKIAAQKDSGSASLSSTRHRNPLRVNAATKIRVNQSCSHLCYSRTKYGIWQRRFTTPASECSRLEDFAHTLTIALGAIYSYAEIPADWTVPGWISDSGTGMQLTI